MKTNAKRMTMANGTKRIPLGLITVAIFLSHNVRAVPITTLPSLPDATTSVAVTPAAKAPTGPINYVVGIHRSIEVASAATIGSKAEIDVVSVPDTGSTMALALLGFGGVILVKNKRLLV